MTGLCPCGAAAAAKGKCRRCYAREYARARKARRAANPPTRAPLPFNGTPRKRVASDRPAQPVAWDKVLTELRRAAGAGAAVGIGQHGVVIDRVACKRLVFASLEEALDWATSPSTL
jgi:hypothetical protein